MDYSGNIIGSINKEIFHMSDTYSLTIEHDEDAFYVLMIVLAIDVQNVAEINDCKSIILFSKKISTYMLTVLKESNILSLAFKQQEC